MPRNTDKLYIVKFLTYLYIFQLSFKTKIVSLYCTGNYSNSAISDSK